MLPLPLLFPKKLTQEVRKDGIKVKLLTEFCHELTLCQPNSNKPSDEEEYTAGELS